MAEVIRLENHPHREFLDSKGGQWATETSIGKDVGAKECNIIVITKKPGFQPLSITHYHPNREEFFVILEGKAHAIVNDSEIILEPGMVVFVPSGEKHYLHLRAVPMGKGVFRMIEFGSTVEEDDVWIEESQKAAEKLIESSILHS